MKLKTLLLLTTGLCGFAALNAYADAPSGGTDITQVENTSGKDLYVNYQDTTSTFIAKNYVLKSGAPPVNITDIIGTANYPSHIVFNVTEKPYAMIKGKWAPQAGDTNYCRANGNDWYVDQYTGGIKQYPVLINSEFVPWGDPSIDVNNDMQPFVAVHVDKYKNVTGNIDLVSDMLYQGAMINIAGRDQCFFNNFNVDHKSQSITAYAANSTGVIGTHYDFDLQKIFLDKTPNPTLKIAPIGSAGWQGFHYLDQNKGNVLSTKDKDGTEDYLKAPSSGNTYTFQMCACDTQLEKDKLGPGEAGSCGANALPDCGTPPANALTWVNPETGSIGSTLTLQALSGVFAKSPIDIQTDKVAGKTQTLLMVDRPYATGSVAIPVASLFKTSSGVTSSDLSYKLVSDGDTIVGRNNGNDPTGSDTTTYPLGQGWGPRIIHNGSVATTLPDGSITMSGSQLQIVTSNQQLKTLLDDSTNGLVIQATIEADATTGTTQKAYQTIYVLLHKDPATTGGADLPVNLMQHRIQAWAYAPTVKGLTTPDYQPGVDAKCNLPGETSDSFSPLDSYLKTVNDSHPTGAPLTQGITEITPDIGWIQFPGVMAVWPTDPKTQSEVFSNNAVTNPYIGCFANYFKNGVADQKNFKFIVTMEFDSNVHGYVTNLSDQPTPNGELGAPLSQVSLLSNAVLKAANPDKIKAFTNAHFSIPTGENLVDGIQFDVEPLPAGGSAEIFFKRSADLLARQGKINQVFAFASADSGALIMAQGPLGLFLPSAYDVGNTAFEMPNDPHGSATTSNTSYWGNRQGYTPYAKPSASATSNGINDAFNYPQSFLGNVSLDPVNSLSTAMDYYCHWKQDRDADAGGKGGDQPYIIGSYCNYDQTNSIYNNANLFNASDNDIGGADFETRNEMYHGHFSLSIPAEGSATAWNYVVIYNPRLANGSGGACDLTSAEPCTISGLPNTYIPDYIGLDYFRTLPYLDKDGNVNARSEYKMIKDYITANKPTFGHYDVFYSLNAHDAKYVPGTTPAARNPVDNGTTPACSMSAADDPTKVKVCDAIVLWHNDGSVDQDASRATTNSDGAAVSMTDATGTQDIDNMDLLTQGNYSNVIFALANTKPTAHTKDFSLLLKTPLGTPVSNPDYNMGVAMYALSSTEVTGCSPEGSHGENANCPDDYPTSFIGTDGAIPASATASTGIWSAVSNYMDNKTWILNGGSPAPTPPAPGKPSVQPQFIDDNDEQFTVQNLPTGKSSCTISIAYPGGEFGPTTAAFTANGKYDLPKLSDPINFAVAHPDETYQWRLVCDNETLNSGTFHRYGDKIALWLVNSAGTQTSQLQFNEDGQLASQTYSSIPDGDYTVQYEPKSVNDARASTVDHNSLLTPTLDTTAVTVTGTADSPVHLSFKS